jgi:hypothetical protein
MANMDYFLIKSDKKIYVFACTTSKIIILLEIIIKAEDDPENAFPNWEAMVDLLVISLRNPYE